MKRAPLTALAVSVALASTPAGAACRQELAVYSEQVTGASLEFRPNGSQVATTHQFRVLLRENATILDGIVMFDAEVERPYGILMHQCPEGDVTGAELEACTLWQGIVYATDATGRIGLLPAEGADAGTQILLPGLGPALRQSRLAADGQVKAFPADAFAQSGCQE